MPLPRAWPNPGRDWFGPNRGAPSLGSPRIASPPRQIGSALLNKIENHFSSMRKNIGNLKNFKENLLEARKETALETGKNQLATGKINWKLGGR